jgi:hypothetical protein
VACSASPLAGRVAVTTSSRMAILADLVVRTTHVLWESRLPTDREADRPGGRQHHGGLGVRIDRPDQPLGQRLVSVDALDHL